MHPLEPRNAASVDVIDGLTSIEVAPDPVPRFTSAQQAAWLPASPAMLKCYSTGARVTVGFRRSRPLPPDCVISLYYDMAGDGTRRRMRGTPQLTHTLACPADGAWYHYRLSQWIPAHLVMHVVDSLPAEAAYVRLRTDMLGESAHSNHSGVRPAEPANHRHQVES